MFIICFTYPYKKEYFMRISLINQQNVNNLKLQKSSANFKISPDREES